MVDPSAVAGPPPPTLAHIGASVADLLDRGSTAVVVVVAAAPSVDDVVANVRAELGARGHLTAAVRASRTDRTRQGALRSRRPVGWFDLEQQSLIASDLHWADDESIEDLVASAGSLAPGRRLVVVHSTALPTRALAMLHQVAKRTGGVIAMEPSDVSEVADMLDIDVSRAGEVVAASRGWPDLFQPLWADGSLVQAVTERLSVLDDTTRSTAELIAFGSVPERLVVLSGIDGARLDHSVAELTIEGLLHRGRMIPAVADAVRRSTTPARRSRVVRTITELDEPGSRGDLAAILLDLDDRSDAAGELYAFVAAGAADGDPASADRFLAAARASRVEATSLATTEARIGLSTGDPGRALRALHGVEPTSEVELIRASALVANGDLEAATFALGQSSLAELGRWSAAGIALPVAADTAPTVSTAGSIGLAIDAWLGDDMVDAFDHLRMAVIRFASETEPASWPTTPHVVTGVLATKFGDLVAAERTLATAVDEQSSGQLHHRSHLLALAWIAARQGRLDEAAVTLRLVVNERLTPQQRLWRACVECAIAVRDVECDAIGSAVAAAVAAAGEVGTHMYDLDLLTDAAAAAQRAHGAWAPDLLASFAAIADRLDGNERIGSELAWARLSVALASDDVRSIVERAQAMVAATGAATAGAATTGATPFGRGAVEARRTAADLLAAAGSGVVDAAATEVAARRLAEAGAAHEAARLCGVLAVVSRNETDTRRLLKESRTWRAQRTQLRVAASPDRGVIRLSEQEQRVARLVLDGHTHKQIGSTMFISAKTVEHHVAHIRTKLGAGSRAELLAAVRAYLNDPE